MYGSTEGTVGLINAEDKIGAVGFISRIFPFMPVTLVKLDENGIHHAEGLVDPN
jgi:hypothetical protein